MTNEKKYIGELTEGMRRLCAVANRIVAADGRVSMLEMDLLMEDLRRLYDVALAMREGESNSAVADADEEMAMPDEEMLSSTVMATMAAMGADHREEQEAEAETETESSETEVAATEAEPVVEAEPEPEVVAEEVAEPEVVVEPEAVEPVSMAAYETDGSLLFDEIIVEPQPAEVEPEEEPIEEPIEQPTEEPKAEPTVEPTVEEPTVEEPVSPTPAQDNGWRQSSLLDYLKHPTTEEPTVRTLGERLGAAQHEIPAMTRKVDDLRTVININDKFSFMSELFRNNMRAYNEFIMRLNDIGDRAEAEAEVAKVAEQYGWDEASQTVQAFYRIFDKKF